MKKLKILITSVSALAIVAIPTLTYADHISGQESGAESSGSSSSTDSSSNSGSGLSTTNATTATTTESKHGSSSSDATSDKTSETESQIKDSNKAETEGRDFVNSLLKTEKKHTDQQRTKNCQAAQSGLTQKLTNIQKNAASFESKVDSVYQKALAYQQTNNLNPSGIDQLEATANADQAAAKASVGALSNLSVNLDCGSSSVAETVATFRAATSQARTDLQTYKSAVQAVLTALKGATQ